MCTSVIADDAVGVFRVVVCSNGELAVAMPFLPFGGGDPGSFLSGPFVGNGGDGSDLLHHVSATSLHSYAYSPDGWICRDGTPSIAVEQGDAVVFSPGGGQPLDFLVYGKVPMCGTASAVLPPGESMVTHGYPSLTSTTNGLPPELSAPVAWDGSPYTDGAVPWWEAFIVTNRSDAPVEWTRHRPYLPLCPGYPRIAGMAVDGEGNFAEMHVVTGGRKTDVLSLDSADGFGAAVGWTHLGRASGKDPSFGWRDSALADIALSGAARFYMASDAQRDADGDGVPDAVERYVYGTSPALADTDGDGVCDGFELAWGTDPLSRDQPAPYSFTETFESPGVRPGNIGGQRGWMAADDRSAVVQGRVVHEGAGALELGGELCDMDTFDASHSVTCSADAVWVDCRLMTAAVPYFTSQGDHLVSYAFDGEGHPVMTDGDAVHTNFLLSAERASRWTRCTCMLDFRTRTWDFYVDGMIAGSGLALRGEATSIHDLGWSGSGFVDDVKVSTERPSGLSSDGDALPDEWEFRHFGTLERDGSGDVDGDGISDLAEFRAGTDPLSPDIDTDGDGRPDWWELANGLDPRSAESTAQPIFAESFEQPEVSHGDVDGQHGWVVRRPGNAVVQGDLVHSGAGALRLAVSSAAEDDETVSISHAVESDSDIVWIDARQFVSRGMSMRDVPDDAFVLYGFDADGHPVMADGDRIVTNRWCAAVEQSKWVRCTCRVDFGEQVWDLYVNGLIVGRGLAMRGRNRTMHAVVYDGASGAVDDIVVTKERPSGLSSDGDMMPDEWELDHFGTLDRDGSGDADGDGLSDFAEFRTGTDPSVPDTDGDGIPDGWEAANGLDPMSPADAALDPDGDGTPNADEYAFGGDPNLDEPDPRVRRPGLRCEFWRMYGKHVTMPDFVALMPSALSVTPRIEHPGVPWLDDGTDPGNYFACRMEGFIRIPSAGRYTFHLTSSAGAVLSVDGETVLSDPVEHSSRERSVSLDLSVGFHPIRVDFYKNKGSEALVLEWSGEGLERSVVPDSAFCHIPEDEAAPHGYVHGLDVAYYAFPSALRAMPDVEGMSPAATCVVGRVFQPRTADAWEGAPETLVDRFAAVYQGALLAPEPGRYTFALSSDDGARLWIDGEKVIDRSPAQGWATRRETVALAKGVHELKVEHFENSGTAGVQLAWSKDGTPSEVIPARFFLRPSGEPVDGDGDGMPDWWEEAHGLAPADPSDAALDPDGDGLTNLDEFLAGTDPNRADTDGDGLPDAWEVSHGLCPFDAKDALDDADSDGASNIEEFLAGADLANADTDGDGISDGDEMHLYFSDPSSADFSGDLVTNAVLSASDADAAYGSWYALGDEVILAGRSGTVLYTNDLQMTEPGILKIGLKTAFRGPYDSDLVCRVDGERVGAVRLLSSGGVITNEVAFLTRWIQAGLHSVSFELQNFANDISFSLWDVVAGFPSGPDTDGNGRADWLDARMRNSRTERGGVVHSKVSPFCMKGRAMVPPAASVPSGALTVKPLPHSGWWANVPLEASEATEVSITHDGGMKSETATVSWEPFDVRTESGMVLRCGDSLLLSIGGVEGTISVDGEVVATFPPDPVPYRFETCGDHVVSSVCGEESNAVTVRVVQCSMGAYAPIWRGRVNSLRFEGSGFSLMQFASDHGAEIVSSEVVGGFCACSVSVPEGRHPAALSCLIGNPDASVVDSVALKPFSANYTIEGKYYISDVLDDGTQIVENRISAFDVPDSLDLRLSANSGICFEDGAGVLWLNAGSFGPTGDCIYRFYVPEGVTNPCQFLRAYRDGRETAR